jgi:predicted component of type VI protein secretion system
MSLILTVNALPETLEGAPARMVFGATGGRIGRGRSNDWVLPDEQRYLSSHHARICCVDGQYFVDDLSTNGTYLNSDTEPLGRTRSRPLRDGDRIRMGAYRFQVALADETPTANLKQPDTAEIVGDEILIDHSQSLPKLETTNSSGAASPPAERRATARAPGGGLSELESFCRGAGIDYASLGANVNSGMLYVAGLLLRESLVGAREMIESQRTIRAGAQLPAPVPTQRDVNLQRSSVEDLLRQVLTCDRAEALENVHWLRDQFAQARRHDHAMINALRAALSEYLRRLDPQSLGEGAAAQSRFRNLTEADSGAMPVLFVEALVRHFAADFRPAQPGSPNSRSAA